MTATGNAGQITAIDGIPVSALRWADHFAHSAKFPTSPASYADNFNLNLVASGDDQPYVEVVFGQGVTGVYLIENHGNDSGFMQALDATGNLVGPVVPFTTSDYLKTSYRTANNRVASGLLFGWRFRCSGYASRPQWRGAGSRSGECLGDCGSSDCPGGRLGRPAGFQ